MADVLNLQKNNNYPVRMMGEKSADHTARSILYHEVGSFTLDGGTTSATIPTDLTSVVGLMAFAKAANGATALAGLYSTYELSSGAITINYADPTTDAEINFILIGQVEG